MHVKEQSKFELVLTSVVEGHELVGDFIPVGTMYSMDGEDSEEYMPPELPPSWRNPDGLNPSSTQVGVAPPPPGYSEMYWISLESYVEYADNLIRKFLTSNKSKADSFSYVRDDIDPTAAEKLATFSSYCSNVMSKLLEEDQTTGVAFDILEKYADRVDLYSQTAINALDAEEGSGAVKEYIMELSEASNAGVDILENINPQQLGLKLVTLQRQTGNENESYIPNYSLMNDNIIEAIKILNSNKSVAGQEGLNIRTLLVGLPSGLIDSYSLQSGFSLIVNNVDLEYNDLVFKPKYYNFDPSIYVISSDLEKTKVVSANDFKSLVKLVPFTKIKFDINYGSTADPVMSLDETDTSVTPKGEEINLYSNHLISFLLECYYRIMTGLEINEDTFLSDYNALGLGVSAASADLAGAIGGTYGASTGGIIEDYGVAVESRVIEPGDFPEIDEELMSQARNTLTSRLLSPEQMRDNILAAKMFDRTFMVMVDPDEFIIATKENCADEDAYAAYTSFKIINKYLAKGLIRSHGTDEEGNTIYKLAPRRMSEGRMAFNQFFVTIGKSVSDPDNQVDL
ncbi:MAG: hypothetical protein CL885_03500 [Dehalococcoidia bacterium]|nr:hypothetical protein [Dehalococcoidia bacterium]